MPEMDGFEATRQIRLAASGGAPTCQPRVVRCASKAAPFFAAGEPLNHPTIVALTAGAMAHEREECRKAGMDGFLTKPVRPQDIEAALGPFLDP